MGSRAFTGSKGTRLRGVGAGRVLAAAAMLVLLAAAAQAVVYEVGPGQAYTSIGAVPWESIAAGDTVRIHWQPTPYYEKFAISAQGTLASPILIQGVPDAGGALPIIDGNGATTRLALSYWNDERCVIKVGGGSVPPDQVAKYITFENLEVRSARSPYTYTCDEGTSKAYTTNASSFYVCFGENITLRNCILRDCANGLMVTASDAVASQNVLIEGCYIYDNGRDASIYEHNTYNACKGIIYQYNHYGPLRTGCSGNNLKDRSSGMIVRYNWIESGNRQLDLVEGQDSVLIRTDPAYSRSFVYGNILIEPAAAGNRQIVHYGGDSGITADYRKGTLHFYNNTVVSTRTDMNTLFRISTADESVDARNNIIYGTIAGNLQELERIGRRRDALLEPQLDKGRIRHRHGDAGRRWDDGYGSEPGVRGRVRAGLPPGGGVSVHQRGRSAPCRRRGVPGRQAVCKAPGERSAAVGGRHRYRRVRIRERDGAPGRHHGERA